MTEFSQALIDLLIGDLPEHGPVLHRRAPGAVFEPHLFAVKRAEFVAHGEVLVLEFWPVLARSHFELARRFGEGDFFPSIARAEGAVDISPQLDRLIDARRLR